jgi:hypothetical protein
LGSYSRTAAVDQRHRRDDARGVRAHRALADRSANIGGVGGAARSRAGGRRGRCTAAWVGPIASSSSIATSAESPRGNRLCFFAVGPREHETAENEAKRCASNLRKRARLPPVGSDDDATGTVSGKGGEMLRRGAKSKKPGNQRRLFGTDAELAGAGRRD